MEQDRARERAERSNAERAANAQALLERERLCAPSRAERLADIKKQIEVWQKTLKEIAPFEDWTIKHCKLHDDTRGVEVSHQRTGSGSVVVRTKHVGKEDEMTCNAPLPATMTMWKVRKLLELHEYDPNDATVPGDDSGGTTAFLGSGHDAENERCRDADRAAGVRLYLPLYDFEAIKKTYATKLDAP